jgi:hypothetical protein
VGRVAQLVEQRPFKVPLANRGTHFQ